MTRTIKICIPDIARVLVFVHDELVQVFARPDDEKDSPEVFELGSDWLVLDEGKEFTVEVSK